ERARVKQFILKVMLAPPAILDEKVLVGKSALRVVVTPPVPGMARNGVEIPPILLDVLTMIRFRPGQSKRPFLKNRVAPVPQRQAQAQPLLHITDPGQPVLAPSVGPRPGMIMRQVAPRLPIAAVIFPDRPPLALAEVRPPQIPVAGLPEPVLRA